MAPSAVSGEDVIGDPHRDEVTGDGVNHVPASEDPGNAFVSLAVPLRLHSCGFHVRLDFVALGVRGQACHEFVFGRQHHEGHAIQGVGPRGEDVDFGAGRVRLT